MTILNRRHMLMAGGAAVFVTGAPFATAMAQTGATPALPPAPTPAQWAKSNAISHVNLSPDGKHICYVTEVDAVKFLYAYDLATKQVQSFNIGTSDVSALRWIDSTHILVTALVPARFTHSGEVWSKGQERSATIFNIAEATQNVLFANVPDFESLVAGPLIPILYNGKWQVAAASFKLQSNTALYVDYSDEYAYLYRFDLDGNKSYPMDQAKGVRNWVLAPNGDMVARTIYNYKTRRFSIDYHKGNSWKEIYSLQVERRFPFVLGLAGDGKGLILTVPNAGDTSDIYQLSAEGILSAPLIEREKNAFPTFDQVTYRHDGFATFDGWIHYEYADPLKADIVAKAQKATDGYRMTISDFADDPNRTIIYTEGDDDAGTYYYIDFTTKKPLEIGKCYPDIPTEWITSKQKITYKAGDGLQIPAYLTLPANRTPANLPLVVYPHDGPQDDDGMALDWIVQALASRGYAVLQPNYRGSTRNGQAFIEAGQGEWGGKMLTDLSDGVAYLAGKGIIDSKRVCIFGSGYGGYMALAGVSLQSGIYNCAIDSAGISDLNITYHLLKMGDDRSPSYKWFMRLVGENTDLNAISPAQNAAKVNVPVMIIHSEQDTSVDIQQSRKMVDAMKSAGKPVDFIEFKAEDNWGIVEKSRIEFITYVTDFLAKHNPA